MTPSATVIITPIIRDMSSTLALTAVTGTADPAQHQVGARLLAVSSPTQTHSIPTSGHGHSDAAQAHGSVIFYNAAPYVQTVRAGTLLTGIDGVQVVTDAVAVLPASNLSVVGSASVAAHAVQVGPQGNIATLDLNGLCCIAGVSVKNTTDFRGGQVARDYPMVTHHDIDEIALPLSTSLTHQAQSDLQRAIHPTEHLASSVQCAPITTPDHAVGSEAAQVTISVVVRCRGEVYDEPAVEQRAEAQVSTQAQAQLGTTYILQAPITAIVTKVSTAEQASGTLSLLVHAAGIWQYQFGQGELSLLLHRMVGMPKGQAQAMLLHERHVEQVHITIPWSWQTQGNRLPEDTTHIQIMVLGTVQ